MKANTIRAKKHLLFLFAALLPLLASAQTKVEIDGVWYNLKPYGETKQAEVTSKSSKYTGIINIPSTVTYGGVVYSVTSIGYHAFYNCTSLTSITIPEGVTSIGDEAFYNCSSLTSITIPDNSQLTSIGSQAFYNCSSLTSITIPENSQLTSIEAFAFFGCSSLTTITIPEGVASIGYYAFDGCSSLTSITLPEGVTSIGNNAFDGCSSLTSINIPEGVTSIESSTFRDCSSLTSITLPEGMTSIGNYAFYRCCSLTAITIPESVTSIGDGAFYNCIFALNNFVNNSTCTHSSNWGAKLFEKEYEGIFINNDTVVSYRPSITIATIPEGVTSIGDDAFYNCSSLTAINIPENSQLTSIGNYAFSGCSSLTAITIPEGVTEIEGSAFSYCSNLTDIYCYTMSVPKTSTYAFYNVNLENVTLHGRRDVLNDYKSTSPWKDFGKFEVLTNIAIKGITLSHTSASITEGDTIAITPIINPDDAGDKSCTWSSSDESVATVDSMGMVTAISKGKATITATSNSNNSLSASCEVEVIRLVSSITLNQSEVSLKEGDVITFEAIVAPNSANDTSHTWSSSDTAIATVDSAGTVTAISKGTAIITATANDGSGVKATCEVTVRRLVQSIKLNHSSISPAEGEKLRLTATVNPESATDTSYTWSSSDTAIATVDSAGTVTAISKGTAIITATANDGSGVSATCEVTVRRLVTEITLSQTAATLREGDIITLKATVAPSSANNTSYTWSSSDKSVATVDAAGKVEAISKGKATITATANDGSGVKTSCEIEVIRMVEKITLSKTIATLKEGENITLKATVAPSSANDISYTWSSSDESVATVDDDGKVVAISKGTAIITATANDGSGVKASCEVEVIRMVAEMTLSRTSIKVVEGEKTQLTAYVAPADANNTSYTWSSSNESVATVDTDGTISGIVKGKTIITATANDGSGVSASCEVEVVRLVTEITLDKTSVTLKENENVTLIATVVPDDASDKSCNWTSSDESVATVDDDGKVIAVSRGFATIIATANDGSGVKASCEIEVIRMVSEIVLNYTTVTMAEGDNLQLVATVHPSDANDISYIWSSSNEDIVMVNNKGKIVAAALGTAVITATANDGSGVSASCTVKVVVPVSEILLNQVVAVMVEGDILNLEATIVPENATDPSYTWSSDNEDVAMVNSKGRVVAVAPGVAHITATANDYKGVSASCYVNVLDPNVGVDDILSGVIMLSNHDGVIIVAGVSQGTEIAVYDLMGRKLATATTAESDGITKLQTGLASGSTAIIKIGADSFKVIMK